MGVAAIAAGLVLGMAVRHDRSADRELDDDIEKPKYAIEGLTLDQGNLYVPRPERGRC